MAEDKNIKSGDIESSIEDTLRWVNRRNAMKRNDDLKVNVKIASETPTWKYVRTGVPSFDIIYGGIPLGKVTVIYGPQSSGKTTLALQTIGLAQKAGLRVLLVASEGAYDNLYAEVNGVDSSKLLMLDDMRLGAGGQLITELVDAGKIDLVVIDSITMLLPEEIARKQVQEDDMAIEARRITRLLKKILPGMIKNNVGLVIISQVRHQIGGGNPGGPPIEVYNGGNALKHMSVYTIKMRPTARSNLRGNGKFLAELNLRSFSAICEKSKSILVREGNATSVDTPYMFFGFNGLDKERTLFEHARRFGIIEQKGAKYTFTTTNGEEISFTGEINFVNSMRENRDIYDKLFNTCWNKRIEYVSDRTQTPIDKIIGNMEIIS